MSDAGEVHSRRLDLVDRKVRRIDSIAVLDGAITESYWNTEPRVLWVLREANSPGKDVWDLREFLRSDKELFGYARSGSTWATVAKVSAGILQECRPWGNWAWNWRSLTPYLRRTAIINVSKRGGQERTDLRRLATMADRFSDVVTDQIEALAPTLVVAAGSYGFLPGGIAAGLGGLALFSGRTISGIRWIPAYHPGQRHITARVYYERVCRAWRG